MADLAVSCCKGRDINFLEVKKHTIGEHYSITGD
jgi:hypothetical protein